MDLTKCDDKYIKYYALTHWANFIETGDVSVSAEHAARMNDHEKIKPLNRDQHALVVRLRDMANREVNSPAAGNAAAGGPVLKGNVLK